MILYILNLADLLTTLISTALGLEELNPIVAALLAIHPALYAALKIALYPLCRYLVGRESYPYLVGAVAAVVAMNIAHIFMIGGA